ncbi:ABC transporter ATP-binding protein [Persicimonas caeni]|uniref:ABC transporter ATP-binding protein n=1 Tax=Persicimonas caeni TaxID=2292766 RepID=UPI00143D77F3|nr:ATP-binding cassette domain-containing protein [Persicimonas caeni]
MTEASEQNSNTPAQAAEDRKNLLVPDVERWPVDGGEPIIELRDVHKSFGDETVLDGLSLTITPGEITVIMGASASGKSVLIKHMNGLLKPDEGQVMLFGNDTKELGDVDLDRQRKRVGTLFQNYALFDSMTVLENVAFPLVENKAMSIGEAEERAAEILDDLGLGHVLDAYPPSLSGGMKKRVSLARAIIPNPEVVLFDEPTTGLDPIMMEFVDDMILDITERFGLTSVIISHDIASTMRLADSIAILYGGKIIAHGPPDEIRKSDDERIQKLLAGANKTDISADTAASTEFGEDYEYTVRVTDVYKSFGNNDVLKGVSFTLPKDKITILIGASGSGKSVMMKHILGLFQPDRGKVEVFGNDLSKMSESELREMRTKIGMLFQHAALFDSMTVAENVAFPLVARGTMSQSEAAPRVDDILDKLRLSKVRDDFPNEISNGQQKRVSLARALLTEPKLMIYDEPTTGQDPILAKYVEDMIVETQEAFDVTSVIISHDMAQTFRIADKVALLHHGEIIAEGAPASLLESEDERVREFVFAADVSRATKD